MTKAELIQKCEELGIDHEPLTNNEQRQAAIDAKEAELEALESLQGAQPETSGEDNPEEEVQEETSEEQEDEQPIAASEISGDDSPEEETSKEQEAPGYYKDKRGRRWTFKETAPKTLNIEGHPLTQAEILKDEFIIEELVYGNCSFLTQINEFNGNR